MMSLFPENQVSTNRDPNQVGVPPSGIISGTAPGGGFDGGNRFVNSKESPYLQELREQSLKRQIDALQKQLQNIQSSRG